MKKAITILLMVLLAFNWGGYWLLSRYIEHQSDLALQREIEKQNYEETSFLELRVPLNAPYLSGNTTEFERVDGEIEIDGMHYKYVKRKVDNGELLLICIPNENKTRILNSRADFFKMVNDVNQNSEGKNKNPASYKSFTTEYPQESNSWLIARVESLKAGTSSMLDAFITDGFNPIHFQPPRA